jgi:hypothetical protein
VYLCCCKTNNKQEDAGACSLLGNLGLLQQLFPVGRIWICTPFRGDPCQFFKLQAVLSSNGHTDPDILHPRPPSLLLLSFPLSTLVGSLIISLVFHSQTVATLASCELVDGVVFPSWCISFSAFVDIHAPSTLRHEDHLKVTA